MHLPARAALVALSIALVSPAARADQPGVPPGLESELPGGLPASGCVPELAQRLARAGEAVRAHYLPLEPLRTETIQGVRLSDDPRALDVLRRSLGARPPHGWARAAACKNVLCALRETFTGNAKEPREAALWLLAIAAESDAVASLDQSPWKGAAESVWQASELRALYKALADLPPALKKLPNLKAFRRVPENANPFNGANAFSSRSDPDLGGKGSIWVRDTVWQMPGRAVREVVAHESAHQLEYGKPGPQKFPISHSPEWLATSKWQPNGNADPESKEGFKLPPGTEIGSTGETPLASEDFPDSVANYRYLPRLLRAYSPAKYAFIKRLAGGEEFEKPPLNPELDAALAPLGGPLGALRQCAAGIQRAWRRPLAPQAQLFVVQWKKGGGSEFATWYRSFFVTHSPCLEQVLERLRAGPQWKALACRQDSEDLTFELAQRLEGPWAGFAEAAQVIRAAVPEDRAQQCLATGNLTVDCFAGERALALADVEARRILTDWAQDPKEAPALAQLLLAQTPLGPPDEELLARFPVLHEPQELLGACLLGAVEVSTEPGKENWMYWVKNPPRGELRGFPSPLWSPACHRDFAADLKRWGIAMDPNDALFEHLAYLLKNHAGPLEGRLTADVLRSWGVLRAECGIPAATKAGPGERACTVNWLRPRLAALVPPALLEPVTRHLAEQLRGP